MNVIMIVSDTYRYDNLAVGGGKGRAPELDAFLAQAVSFDHCYVSSFPTIPHRTDAFTGKFGFPHYGWQPLLPELVTLAEVLQNAGYATQLICDTPHLCKRGFNFDRGFHSYYWLRGQEADLPLTKLNVPIPDKMPRDKTRLSPMNFGHTLVDVHSWVNSYWEWEEDRLIVQTARTACKWLEQNYKADPFFLWVDCFDPHEPWDPPEYMVEHFDPGYKGVPMLHPNYGKATAYTKAELRNLAAHYRAEAMLVSKWVGHIMRKIEELGLYEDTIVGFTTDHGMYAGEHNRCGKSNISKDDDRGQWPLYEEITHIPLAFRIPGMSRPKRIKQVVQPTDIMPTVLDLAKVKCDIDFDGASLAPLIKGAAKQWPRRCAFSSSVLAPKSQPKRPWTTVTDETWTLLVGGRDHDKPELYNMKKDPGQQHNVIRQNPAVAKRLHKALIAFLEDKGTAPDRIEPLAQL